MIPRCHTDVTMEVASRGVRMVHILQQLMQNHVMSIGRRLAQRMHSKHAGNTPSPCSERKTPMRRIILILAAVGMFGVTANQAIAHDGHGYGGCHSAPYYHDYYRPAYIAPRLPYVMATPPVVVARPPYGYRYYAPVPQPGFYYRGSGISIGIGF
jgi:hypothetical protein